MPPIQQMTPEQFLQATKKPKVSGLKKFLRIMAVILVSGIGYMYYASLKITKINDDVYAMYKDSYFKELFATPYKKVIWFGADCPVSQRKKLVIDTLMKASGFNEYYLHRPFLQNSLAIGPNDKLGNLIMQKCGGNICIIAPESFEIIQTSEENILRDLNKYVAR